MIVMISKKTGTWHVSSEVLKMSVNIRDNWSAQYLKVERETEFGPGCFPGVPGNLGPWEHRNLGI